MRVVVADLGFISDEHQIAGERDFETAGACEAINGCNRRNRQRLEIEQYRIQAPHLTLEERDVLKGLLQETQVKAHAERAAAAGEHEGAQRLVRAHGSDHRFEIGQSLVRGWSFKTIVQGSSVPQEFTPRLVSLWQQGRFPVERVTRQYKFDDINQAFADSESGAVVKPVVV